MVSMNLFFGNAAQSRSTAVTSPVPTPSPARRNAGFTCRVTPIIMAKGMLNSSATGRTASAINVARGESSGNANPGGSDTAMYRAFMRRTQPDRNRRVSAKARRDRPVSTA